VKNPADYTSKSSEIKLVWYVIVEAHNTIGLKADGVMNVSHVGAEFPLEAVQSCKALTYHF